MEKTNSHRSAGNSGHEAGCSLSLSFSLSLSLQVSYGKLIPFEEFKKQYNPFHMKGIYKKAVIGALKVGMGILLFF